MGLCRRAFALACALLAIGTVVACTGPPAHATPQRPEVWPQPQSMHLGHGTLAVPDTVRLVAAADPASVATVRTALQQAGAHRITSSGSAGLVVYLGGRGASGALTDLHAEGPGGLRPGGYALGIGTVGDRPTVAMSGIDGDGTYYAAQTFRQLRDGSHFPDVTIRDWPAADVRGVIEGFYGPPWSQADRLAQLDFLGRTKQNTYVYSPKDDPYLRSRWRDPYPAGDLARLRTLVDRARYDHVTFTYALSPGLSVCYSSAADEKALVAKFQSLYDIGVRSFAIPLDDIGYQSWNCPADQDTFGSGAAAAGAAQAHLLNAVQRDFVATHTGLAPLQMVPTEYSDVTDSPYKQAIRAKLDQAVVVEWTGVGVIAPQISASQAAAARAVYGHRILIWDNYPVNDYQPDRLFLGPYIGREPGVLQHVIGVTANPMIQARPSMLAEFTSGAFLWNPGSYDPDTAWSAALRAIGGGPALRLLAQNSYSTRLHRLGQSGPDPESPVLRRLIEHYRSGSGADALGAYLAQLAGLDGADLPEVRPWLTELAAQGRAGQHALAMLRAQASHDRAQADRERTLAEQALSDAAAVRVQTTKGPVRPTVAEGVLEAFVQDALAGRIQPVALRFGAAAATPRSCQATLPRCTLT